MYPVTIIKVNGIKSRALVDTGYGSSYASEAIIDLLNINLIRKEYKTIEKLTNATTKKLGIYSAKIQDLKNEFTFTTKLNKLESEVLLTLSNPKYNEVINKCNHLGGIQMHNTDTKSRLPTDIIMGASNFAKIKMETYPESRTD